MDASTCSWLMGVLLLQAAMSTEVAGWKYEGDHGPAHWHGSYEHCGGSKQSPIHLQYDHSMKHDFHHGHFHFHGYQTVPDDATMTLRNTGHAINVDLTSASHGFHITGGDLNGTYNLAQFHFHWGSLAHPETGSEHHMDDKAFPGEVHFVHYSAEYDDLSAAVASGSETALAVLGFFLQIDDHDNHGLHHIVHNIVHVPNATDTHLFNQTTETFTFDSFLPANKSHFYRYSGSLTTPGCNQVVVWTVFEEPIKISRAQLTRLLTHTHYAAEDGHPPQRMANNYRPIQHLRGRHVYRSFERPTSGTRRISPAWQLTSVAIGVLVASISNFPVP